MTLTSTSPAESPGVEQPDAGAPRVPLAGRSGAPLAERSARRYLEIGLFLLGLLCLGIWAWSYIDARAFQAYESWRFSRSLQSPQSPQAPAASSSASPALALPGDSDGAAPPAPPPPPASPAVPSLPEGEAIGRLEVPRLDLSVMVAQGVSDTTLRRAVGHIPGTALPGPLGNVGLAGHRDTFFRSLKDIRKNDKLTLTTLGGSYQYTVDTTRIVAPEEVQVLEPTGQPTLTLVTCYPFYYVGAAPKRFIVQAHLTSPAESKNPDKLDTKK
ncbi:MAG TPA: class D sortase [Thermoanaerobaculia bacterium]|nr:class D sortase [Thermoanaerobaculia bacterium]